MASYNLNDILKKKAQSASQRAEDKEMDLGDAARVKVLSPTRQVMKRFFRNRLAMFGLIPDRHVCILLPRPSVLPPRTEGNF